MKSKTKQYKITNLEGKDFYTNSIKYEVGKTVEAPDWEKTKRCGNGLHLLDDINKIKDITGFRLPCRVFEVKIIGKEQIEFNNKIKCKKLKVVKELSIEEINNLLEKISMEDNSSAKLYSDSSAKLYSDSSAILYDNSSAILYSDSSAILYDNSSAILYSDSSAKLYSDSSAILYDNSSAILYDNSSAILYSDSSAILYDNSSAELYGNSSTKLYDNSSAELYDNSVIWVYSNKVIFIPKSITCVVILPYKKVFTFKKSQLEKKYKIVNEKLVEVR